MNHNHEGHRERMRKKFLKYGLEAFEEHEILELLLFYSIPRKNTNEIAHKLINRFGSLADVFDANIEVLKEMEGISEVTIVLLKMMPQLAQKYLNSQPNATRMLNFDEVKDFAIRQYVGEANEILKVIYLDGGHNYIECSTICTLNLQNSLNVDIKKIIEGAEKYNAYHVILMHNHPVGELVPSRNDVFITKQVQQLLFSLHINLQDHIIVGKNNSAISMRIGGYFD